MISLSMKQFFFEFSREEYDDTNKSKLNKYEIDVTKNPQPISSTIIIKNGDGMKNKLIVSIVYVNKPKNSSLSQFKMLSLTVILDSEESFESRDNELKLNLIFVLLHDAIIKHQETYT